MKNEAREKENCCFMFDKQIIINNALTLVINCTYFKLNTC